MFVDDTEYDLLIDYDFTLVFPKLFYQSYCTSSRVCWFRKFGRCYYEGSCSKQLLYTPEFRTFMKRNPEAIWCPWASLIQKRCSRIKVLSNRSVSLGEDIDYILSKWFKVDALFLRSEEDFSAAGFKRNFLKNYPRKFVYVDDILEGGGYTPQDFVVKFCRV